MSHNFAVAAQKKKNIAKTSQDYIFCNASKCDIINVLENLVKTKIGRVDIIYDKLTLAWKLS